MNYFPADLYINPVTGDLTETPVEVTGIAYGVEYTRYTLLRVSGYKAIYLHASNARVLVTPSGGAKYRALFTLAKV